MRAAAFAALALAGGAAALPVGAPAPAPAADEPKRELTVVTPWTTRRPREFTKKERTPYDKIDGTWTKAEKTWVKTTKAPYTFDKSARCARPRPHAPDRSLLG